jgi:hypothetical protein
MSRRARSRSADLTVPIAVLLVVGLGIVGIVLSVRKPTSSRPAPIASSAPDPFPNFWPNPPPADVGALLDGLGPGAPLGHGWRARGVSPVENARVTVDVARKGVGFRVWIVQRDRDQRLPPKRTKKYDLYTAQPRPTAESVSDEDYSSVLGALAQRIAKTELNVPVPAGM